MRHHFYCSARPWVAVLPVIPSSFRPTTDEGSFQPLPLCHLLVCAVVACYFDSLDIEDFDGASRIGAGHLTRRRDHGQRAEVRRREPMAWTACLTEGRAAGRLGVRHAGAAAGCCAGQSHDAHAHMPELGVANLPVVAAMDQPLVEPEVRRSANGVLSTNLRCAYAYRDIGGVRLYLRAYEGGLAPTLRMKPGETLKIRLINDLPPNRDIPPGNPSTPTRSRSSKSAVSRRPIGRGGIPWSCRGRPRAAASSCAHASSTTPASSCFTAT